MDQNLAIFVNVLLPLPLLKQYTYRIPRELENEVVKGKRVVVQFGKKKLYAGVITEILHQPPQGYEAKYILSILDDSPLISEEMLHFWEWLSYYYMCSAGDVMQAALPAAFKPESQTSVTLNPEYELEKATDLTDSEYLIMEALTKQDVLSIDELTEIVQLKNVFPILKNLYAKGAILLNEELKQTYRPKYLICVKLTEAYDSEEAQEKLFQSMEKKAAQLNLLMAYHVLKQEHLHIEKSVLLSKSETTDSPLKTLVNKGIFELYQLQVDRLKIDETVPEPFELNEAQQESFESIKKQFEQHEVVLLHGITSSGKTHIYVKLMEEQLALGKQVLLLLPEIALTSQIILRIRKYFGDQAIAFHSKFSQNERVELWQKVKANHVKIIIGARSAVFLPFENLGLVIVDEEHETSYKQQDPAPRYHARDAAIYLAHQRKCKTLLGSATPSFESYYNAQKGKYGFIHLSQRFGAIDLPHIATANIAEETRVKTMYGHLTSVLHDHIAKALNDHEQVILFQNRRGYAPILECEQCHHVPRCVNCDISLTYHKYNDSLKCHYCGYTQQRMKVCVSCGSHLLNLKGLGTEKIEDEIQVFFPEARIARLDLDSAKGKNGHQDIIQSFELHEADILVGTQMLSKGLDFGNVSVVGVINADQLLYFPDFRAYERAFQLLTQVSGRAGRKVKQGKVIIQTSVPNHHVLQEVMHHRYDVLYANSIEERKQFYYPPFSRLIKLIIKHKDQKTAHNAAFDLYQNIYKLLGDHMVGPQEPHVSRIKNYYIMEILVKLDRDSKYLNASKQFMLDAISITLQKDDFKRSYIYADVDPI